MVLPGASQLAGPSQISGPTQAAPGQGADPLPHPVEAMVAGVEAALGAVSRQAWAGLEAPAVRALYARLSRVAEQVSAHKMAAARVLETAGTAKAEGAASTGSLLGADFGGDRREGDELVRLGDTLQQARADATEDAFGAGQITRAQAGVIGKILKDLPQDVTPEEREAAETTLLGQAGTMSLRDLRARGDRISEVFRATPEQTDADEEQIVARRERRARSLTTFWMRETGEGTYQGGFTIPTVQGELLKTILDAVASPRRNHLHTTTPTGGPGGSDGPGGPGDDRSYPQKLGQAFCALIEHTPTDGFVQSGGSTAVVAVSLSQEKLATGTGCGTTSTGIRLTAGQIRRLACTQQILPQVFDGKSLPLDHGTLRRLFSKHQRIGIGQRDQGCAMPGCDRPPGWCEFHHAGNPWSTGGETNLDQGVMLCAFHHHLIHDQHWQIRFHPGDGIPEFRAPGGTTWARNTRYRPPRDLGVAPTPALLNHP
ncbi:hypothetical protein GCM10009583_32770 [Ornithinicoccus hortensis]|uniref:Uncharacterized protein DUF222 n=2 Tax=Ornithinicoccus hortensis TaxID=82346 RepID=A0A542YTB0_9MICO|nr:uncharacterized protein DUF222 [Ornithinicoccus hortensis]